MTDPYPALLADLGAEHGALDDVVAPLPADAWDAPTPATGWSIRDQVWHLTYFDGQARRAVVDPEGFSAALQEIVTDPAGWEKAIVDEGRQSDARDLLDRWRGGRAALLDSVAALDPKARPPWYGPPMSAMSFVTARLMETWAHGQDVVDGLTAAGRPVARPASARLRHIADLGVRTRGFSYAVRGREAPAGEVWVSLEAPTGEQWTWGDDASPDRVSGPAQDFCLVVTQRRHLTDTRLAIEGPLAQEWMEIAQCFAGAPGPGRPPSAG